MKKIIFFTTAIFIFTNAFAKRIMFQVNMTGQTISPNGVHIAGDFQGWNPATTLMTNGGSGNIYSVLLNISAKVVLEYKFINGDSWSGAEYPPIISQVGSNINGNSNDNRWLYLDSLTNDTTLVPAVLFNGSAPAGLNAVRFAVEFRNSTIINNSGVHIAGDFQGWNPASTKMSNLNINNKIYEYITYLDTNYHEFKYINGSVWTDSEIVLIACSNVGGNRSVKTLVDLVINKVCFGRCNACNVPPKFSTTFKVDMLNADCLGGFDSVTIAGNNIALTNWWGSGIKLNQVGTTSVYSAQVLMDSSVIEYKFRFHKNGNTNWEVNNNRINALIKDTVLAPVCFGNIIGVCEPKPAPSTVTFKVDLSNEVPDPNGKIYVKGTFTNSNLRLGAIRLAPSPGEPGVYFVNVPNVCWGSFNYLFLNGDSSISSSQEIFPDTNQKSCLTSDGLGGFYRTYTRTSANPVTLFYQFNKCTPCLFNTTLSIADTIVAYKQDSVLLNSGTAYSKYKWSTGDTTQSIWAKTSGNYKITVSNSSGCINTKSIAVFFVKGIQQKDTTICSGNNLNFNLISNSLVAYFPFNGDAKDASGNANNGTNYGATLTNDRFGNANSAYSFNGTSSYINVSNSSTLQFNGGFTISAWILASALPLPVSYWFSKGADGGTPYSWTSSVDAVNKLASVSIFNNLNMSCGSSSTSQVPLNNWLNVIYTFDGTNAKAYFNGLLESSIPCNYSIFSNIYDLKFGRRFNTGKPYFWNGKLDDFSIWKKALNSEEVLSLYYLENLKPKIKWSTGETTYSITVNPSKTTTYRCTQTIGSYTLLDSITVTVNQTPKAEILVNCPDVQCFKGNSFNFVDISNDSGLVTKRNWIFYNSTSTDSNVFIRFPLDTVLAIRYKNSLVKITNNGCSDTSVNEVLVWPSPKANFTIDKFSQCLSGNSFMFNDTSSLPIYPVNRLWDFGDGSSSTIKNPTKSFLNSSTYKVKLTVTSLNDCSDTVSKTITIYPNPKAGFVINKDIQCINGNSFNLTDSTKIASGSFSKLWNLGTSITDTSTKSLFSKVYDNVNSYKIKYMATSNWGCKDSLEKTVTVLPSPAPAGAIAGPISGLQTAVPYLYNINQQTGVNYQWNVSNAAIINGQGTNAVTLQWINNGIGKLSVLITNNVGCTDTSYLNLGIGTQPSIINFIPTSAKTGAAVTITGVNLNGATAVKFGGVNAQSFNVVSSNQITAVVGTGNTGDVTVITQIGTATLSGFTYLTNTGLESVNLFNGLKIYPNPAKDELIISNTQKLNGSHIIITDMIGRKIIEENITNVTNEHAVLVNELKAGAYILSIQKEGETNRIKFVKE